MPFTPDYEVPEARQAYTMHANRQITNPNGRVGCLMLHGFMGSPTSSRDMAVYLAQQGITVHCPLLPGHGNLPYKIHGYSRHDWIVEVEEALQHLRQLADEIFFIGHSMGAVLCAYLAQKNKDIRGLVMLAPLYDVPDARIKLAPIIRLFMPWFYPLKRKDVDREIFLGRVKDFDPDIDVTDPSLQEWLVEATRIPIGGVAEMIKMAAVGRKLWPRLKLPALILQGGHDPAVSPGNAQKVFQLLTVEDKHLQEFPEAGHELMRPFDPAHRQVWPTIYEFIRVRSTLKMQSAS